MKIEVLQNFGISESLITKLQNVGFSDLTDIQTKAIENGLFERDNILISAPTNTGKTFVGELASIVSSKQKTKMTSFYLVPLKALAEEKFMSFSKRYTEWGLNVAISTGEHTEFDEDLANYDLIIATYEKLNALLIRNPKIIEKIGLVVVDEIQNIGRAERGPNLEILLTRLISNPTSPQVIGLSSTIPNAKELSQWLKAKLVTIDKRDVDLREGVLYYGRNPVSYSGRILNDGDFLYQEFNSKEIKIERDLGLANLTKISKTSETEQMLVFANTQKNAEETARTIADGMKSTVDTSEIIEELNETIEPTPSTKLLKDFLSNGVAFHHAGLLTEERKIIEDGFNSGLIRVLCSTTTLGEGVNTPAKNVIILSFKTWDKNNMLTRDYKNMSGRAGRIRTKDSFGRSILLANTEKDLDFAWSEYVLARPEPVVSKIASNYGLDKSILGLVASSICNSKAQILNFIRNTFFGFLYYEKSSKEVRSQFEKSIERIIDSLLEQKLISEKNEQIVTTVIGQRCAEELLSPSSVSYILSEITQKEDFIQQNYKELAEGFIHLCCNCSDSLSSNALLFDPRYGEEIKELEAYWSSNPQNFLTNAENPEKFRRTLKTTRMIMKWIEGVPFNELGQYASHGIVKRNAEVNSWLVRSLSRLIKPPATKLDDDVSQFVEELSERIFYGVPASTVEIMRLNIPVIHRNRAIKLANAGYTSINDLANADISELTKVSGFGDSLILKIKKHVEDSVNGYLKRIYHSQIRRCKELRRDPSLLEQLYSKDGDEFVKVVIEIFKTLGLSALYVGDSGDHKVDGIIKTDKGTIVLEGKRKSKGSVTASEAEEVLGKGAEYNPIGHITLGFPYFSRAAIKNTKNTKITLLKVSVIGEMLIKYWQNSISVNEIIDLLLSGTSIDDSLSKEKSLVD